MPLRYQPALPGLVDLLLDAGQDNPELIENESPLALSIEFRIRGEEGRMLPNLNREPADAFERLSLTEGLEALVLGGKFKKLGGWEGLVAMGHNGIPFFGGDSRCADQAPRRRVGVQKIQNTAR
ncbi:MAG: hypothetical protein K8R59_16405 [Thermoanaerobaculales bacterium]|nr:hypothetical protein [Thermoanaerobaculales bacterium]